MAPPDGEIIDQALRNDVLQGRGKSILFHAGNVEFRKLVKAKALEYQMQTEMEKDSIAHEVIRSIEDGGGRFLRRTGDGSHWMKCPYPIVRTKVKQALRDMTKKKSAPEKCTKRTASQSQSEAIQDTPQSAIHVRPAVGGGALPAIIQAMVNRLSEVNRTRTVGHPLFPTPRWTDSLGSLLHPSQANGSFLQALTAVPANLHDFPTAAAPQLLAMNVSNLPLGQGQGYHHNPGAGISSGADLLQTYMLLQQQQQQQQTTRYPSSLMRDREIIDLLLRLR